MRTAWPVKGGKPGSMLVAAGQVDQGLAAAFANDKKAATGCLFLSYKQSRRKPSRLIKRGAAVNNCGLIPPGQQTGDHSANERNKKAREIAS